MVEPRADVVAFRIELGVQGEACGALAAVGEADEAPSVEGRRPRWPSSGLVCSSIRGARPRKKNAPPLLACRKRPRANAQVLRSEGN